MKYFVIRSSEDGEVYLSEMTKDQLENSMTPPPGEDRAEIEADEICGSARGWDDRKESSCAVLIIKGEVVVPKPVEVVTKFELP